MLQWTCVDQYEFRMIILAVSKLIEVYLFHYDLTSLISCKERKQVAVHTNRYCEFSVQPRGSQFRHCILARTSQRCCMRNGHHYRGVRHYNRLAYRRAGSKFVTVHYKEAVALVSVPKRGKVTKAFTLMQVSNQEEMVLSICSL